VTCPQDLALAALVLLLLHPCLLLSQPNSCHLFTNKANEITTLKEHVDVDHVLFAKIIKEELSSLVKLVLERQLAKNKLNVFSFKISKFFGAKDFFKHDVVQKK
jgi:hypothetical protein